MSQQTGGLKISHILIGALVIAAVVTLGPRLGELYSRRNGDNPVPIEFTAFWQPGDNQSRMTIRIGQREETFAPTGPQYTHDDEANRGQTVTGIITSNDEQPIIISECYLEFDHEHIEGEVTREGARCEASAIIPPEIR